MSFAYYISTYLYDILGMSTDEAVKYLKASPISQIFRGMRIVQDVPFDPEFDRVTYTWEGGGAPLPVFAPEESEEGRVTVKVVDGVIKDALLEYNGRKLSPRSWPVQQNVGQIFLFTEPVFIWKMPPRRDIECVQHHPQSALEKIIRLLWGKRKHHCESTPQRGWYMKEINSIHVENTITPNGYTPPPPKPYVYPRFEAVPW